MDSSGLLRRLFRVAQISSRLLSLSGVMGRRMNGRCELVRQQCRRRATSKPATGNDAGRLAADSCVCEAVAVVRDATGSSGHVPSMTQARNGGRRSHLRVKVNATF
jgi:hypothetical protein